MTRVAVEEAARIVGGKSRLATILGIKPPTVHQWLKLERPIPPERCVQIERATGGVVSRRDLRPNDWQRIWPELAEKTEA